MYAAHHLAAEIAGFLDGTVEDLHVDQPTLAARPAGNTLAVTARLRTGAVQRFTVHVTEAPALASASQGGALR